MKAFTTIILAFRLGSMRIETRAKKRELTVNTGQHRSQWYIIVHKVSDITILLSSK